MLANLSPTLILLAALTLILGALLRLRRFEKNARGHSPGTWFKLLGVGLASYLLLGVALLFYRNLLVTAWYVSPARSQASLPAGLTFPLETVRFSGGNQLELVGWFAPSRNGATVIFLHPYGGNRASMLWHASVLAEAGYGVLLYDQRASGESEGDHRSFGWEDPVDVRGAIAFIQGHSGRANERIGLAGCSIGGQIALQAAARYPVIGAVWADGPATLQAGDTVPPPGLMGRIVLFSNQMVDQMFALRLGMPVPPPLTETVGAIAPRPVLFVAGGTPGAGFAPELPYIERYARAAGPNAELWVIADAHHCDGPALHPEEYASRLRAFFDRTLLGKSSP